VVWSFLYHAARSVFVLLTLFYRSERSKELEILVLRHELVILRRQSRRPRFEPADRALLAAVSRALPRAAWSTFLVRPETLLHLAPSTGGAAVDVSAEKAGPAAARTAPAGVDPSSRAREPALGLSADRRRAQAPRARSLSDYCAQGARSRWSTAGARADTPIVALVPASAGGQHVGV
jgi:hypothetical protein